MESDLRQVHAWATVVSCLNDVNMNYIADIIEQEYTDSGNTHDTGNEL